MTTTEKLHVVRVEDHEGSGECANCPRTGLRWMVLLSDGSKVGTECAKRLLGWKITPKSYGWVKNYKVIAEHTESGQTWTLYQHVAGERTVSTLNGALMTIGGARADWERMGFTA